MNACIRGVLILGVMLSADRAHSAESFRNEALKVTTSTRIGFALVEPSATGIQFTNLLSQDRYTTNQIYLNGSGVAAGDVDGDGKCDLFFCGISGKSALYKNLGDFKFTNIADSAAVACSGLSVTGAALADLDGDGDLDLVVNSVGAGTRIFFNDGKASFSQKEVINEGKGGMSLAVADYDGDGSLDLYICNYRTTTLRDQPNTNFRVNIVDGKPVVAFVNGEPTTLPKYQDRYALNSSGNISEFGEVDALYRNDGKGHFSLIPFTGGAFMDEDGKPLQVGPNDWSLAAMFRDLNGDGRPDLYICSDFDSPDRIWINQGGGNFRALPKLALRNTSRFSMGVDVADINRDGNDDIFVLDMLSRNHVTRLTRADKGMGITPIGSIDDRPQFSRNTLQLNRGDGTYAEIAYFARLEASEWSWTPVFLDVDLDGYEDLLVTTGHGRDDMDIDNGLRIERTRRTTKMSPMAELAMRKSSPSLPSPKMAFRNTGRLQFEEVGAAWNFNQIGISHGMCLADLDNDGDLDVIVNNLNAPAGIYRNESAAPRLAVRLQGAGANTRGIGAKIKVFNGAVALQSQEMIAGGRYLSSDEPIRVFAAGTPTNLLKIEVIWPGSLKRTLVQNARPNQYYEIFERAATESLVAQAVATPLFTDATEELAHSHHEDAFDDFARQALLPKRLSQLGPGASWVDLDQDGKEDLVIGTGKGGNLAAFHNEGSGKFTRIQNSLLGQRAARDSAGMVGYSPTNGQTQLLIAFANYEDASTNGACLADYNFKDSKSSDVLPAQSSSIGPLALGDMDGDGTLELFAGGRVLPARYPEPASSFILRSKNDRWAVDPASAQFRDIGMVSSALWSDLNADGYPELILACEWGPLRIFMNQNGKLTEATQQFGLDKMTGWWNGVAAGDFDGDGRMDLVVSNWGLNSKYRVTHSHGPGVFYARWGVVGEIEPIEVSYDPASNNWFPERDLNTVGRAIPEVAEKFRAHRAFAEASIAQILGKRVESANFLEVNCLQSIVLLNRGNRFERHPLPPAAQFSPAFGINVADFDGDGKDDLFISQNFFAVAPQSSRNDAGCGLLLKGKGNGEFIPLDGATSGVRVYGEQRGSAAADYDGDGRVDLVVSQNGAAATLWHNVGANPGLRVRLKGPGANPAGIGAIVRVGFHDGWSPAREVHAGSGYWSQDSAVPVFATPTQPTRIEVLWPGGKRTVREISASGTREILVEYHPSDIAK